MPAFGRCTAGCILVATFLLYVGSASALDLDSDLSEDPWETVTHVSDKQEPSSGGIKEVREAIPIEIPLEQEVGHTSEKSAKPSLWRGLATRRFRVEIGILAFCIVYIINIFIGRQANAGVARAWAKEFLGSNGIFDRNFALVGTGEGKPPLLRHSASEFKLYCTGRRFCKFLEATLKLKPRQDLFSLAIGLIFPMDDQLDVEIYMKESDMPQMVLAIATKKLMRAMLKDDTGEEDVRTLAHKMEVGREKMASWPSEKLAVYAEHSSLFFDVMTDQIVDQVFSRTAFAAHGKYFRLLHFTSEQSFGPKDQRAVLRFSFALPAAESMSELTKLLSTIVAFTDILGNYKLSPDMRRRAEKLRQDISKKAAKDKSKEQQDLLEERRLAKKAEEMDKMKKMTPEQREKYEARKAKIENGRMQKRFVRRA